ncbi:hypothetical protein E3P92_01389 [Wallemia ichthyophaga]|uniref:Uncharacterized protein n=1 Tax=Wallemia ichthyophaga TaxID=245174 RepID=A0A4T0GWJ9_WALIC|nr:hypothetical protein E3P91_01098 [Wallemia ichthyophaga]TIA82833.1 hypothetical protein E3P98_01152 [Wallemia ichthyophaga]TIA92632.1 hypothetical protein E3P97_01403 [Wallemia ichthyophaga]TIB01750.1 hypothetical protein E3P95_01240 [Wallemia ichthyophaga]TIB02728.1 hypothetical protein E3P94_01372 [Wallemia ichthyophaga]
MASNIRNLKSSNSNKLSQSFIPQITKFTLAVDDFAPSHEALRKFIQSDLIDIANKNKNVEFIIQGVAKGARGSLGVGNGGWIKGEYINGRDKLLIDSSGKKIVPLKNAPIESTNQSVRGIWSPYHANQNSSSHWKI